MQHSIMKRLAALGLALLLLLGLTPAVSAFGRPEAGGEELPLDHTPTLAVEQVEGVEGDGFFRGADVSSYLSLKRSGAKFYDYQGAELDDAGFFALLRQAGFNWVRLRVWVDPWDAQGHGYGGGNNDLEAAAILGRWATDAGLRVLIDFHYSDFWADPGKQDAPKAWAGLTLDQKAAQITAYTTDSLNALRAAGVDVGMVQVGNETNNAVCGEGGWAAMAQLFSAGAAAVRAVDPEILIALHFTNPEKTASFKSFADQLNQYGVDYDVLAASWYPYWHGSAENLTAVLKYAADTYGKRVMVAETSWAWTLADGDGWANTVSTQGNNLDMPYPFTQQGQANELTAAAKAVKAVGERGLGVFYWENAWIPVQYAYDQDGSLDEAILAANQQKWEAFGSGWAASYAAEYQPDAAQWYGGSAVDNQAMFDFHGRALDSLWTWTYMMVGTEALVEKRVEEIAPVALAVELGQAPALPGTLRVVYNVGQPKDEPVVWDAEALAGLDLNTPGIYAVPGTVTLSYGLGTAEVSAAVTVRNPNLLANPGFEAADLSMYSFQGGHDWSTDTPHSGSHCLHFYNAAASALTLTQTVALEPGRYVFSLWAQGDAKGSEDLRITVALGGETLEQGFQLTGWAQWQNPTLTFEVAEAAQVTVGAAVRYGPGGWGTFDDLSLRLDETPSVPEPPVVFPFTDVPKRAWYREAVAWAYAQGITAGTEAGKFGPMQSCTREQIVTFLHAAKGRPEPAGTGNPFRDVKKKHYFYRAVLWAVENQVTSGVAPDAFGVGQPCTRAQAVTFLWAAEGKPEPAGTTNPFADVRKKDYYYKAVLWAREQGITSGLDATHFGPAQTCTRAHIVTFLWAAYGEG